MTIKKLSQKEVQEFRTLIEIFKEVFENDAPIPDDAYLTKLLSNSDFMVFVINENEQVVGGLTVFVLHWYLSLKPIAYIYDVGVRPDMQGKGYGKALMYAVCKFCEEKGFDDAYVEAESEDVDAVRFYRKTKYSYEMNAVHFTYSFTDEK